MYIHSSEILIRIESISLKIDSFLSSEPKKRKKERASLRWLCEENSYKGVGDTRLFLWTKASPLVKDRGG
jgi:hypothetical protein